MSGELAKTYDPKSVQEEVLGVWDAERCFHAEPSDAGEAYSVVIPPPNVTAALHLGHALNNTIQDILVRRARMQGKCAVWLPGTDHAGIATQTVVEKRVQREEGKRRTDFARDEFVKKIQAWKDEYEKVILGQLKAMGCSCDFERTAFTMDEPRAKAVREAFFQLFKAGLIYRGKRLVNWDPVTLTALADDEVEMEEVDGNFYYLRYPVCDRDGNPVVQEGTKGSGTKGLRDEERSSPQSLSPSVPQSLPPYITVATTRPETMLGDTAVAINPTDPRAAALKGLFVKLPIVGRIIPIIEDDYVVKPVQYGGDPADSKAQLATGFLKVTPAHDPNDYDIGRRHNLPVINVMAPDASISDKHGWTQLEGEGGIGDAGFVLGKSREEARKLIVKWFKENGLLEDLKPYRHSVGHSYRSHVPIEPYLSDQWYCRVTDQRLAGRANEVMNPSQRGTAFQPVSAATQPNPASPEHGLKTHATEEGLTFYPARYARTYQTWHENIRDWCISRQLWWGHRIPVWSIVLKDDNVPQIGSVSPDVRHQQHEAHIRSMVANAFGDGGRDDFEVRTDKGDGNFRLFVTTTNDRLSEWLDKLANQRNTDTTEPALPIIFEDLLAIPDDRSAAKELLGCIDEIIRDPDVLDTWFSSGLWPLSTLGWPGETKELARWNPTNVLCTAREIITLWVSRMVMFNEFFKAQLPFNDVFIHAMIQDGHGQKMSKSLGNGVDPLDIIDTHGADAMRFTLTSMTTHTQDVRMPVDSIDPATGEIFTPTFITDHAGYKVAAPVQEYKGKKFVSTYGLASGQAAPTKDMPLARNTSSKFDLGRNFCNKLWNAARFVMGQIQGQEKQGLRDEGTKGLSADTSSPQSLSPSVPHSLSLADRWILSRLNRTITEIDAALGEYRFDQYAKSCYDFFWRDFCDWYVEAAKPQMKDDARKARTARVLSSVLDASLRLMHPMIPFITEKVWWQLNDVVPERGIDGWTAPGTDAKTKSPGPAKRAITAQWPVAGNTDESAEQTFAKVQDVITAIRNVRSEYKIEPRKSVAVSIAPAADLAAAIEELKPVIELLGTCSLKIIPAGTAAPVDAAKAAAAGCELFVEGLIDKAAEEQRAGKRREELTKTIAALKGRLANKGYIAKAPPALVQETQNQLAAAEAELEKLGGM